MPSERVFSGSRRRRSAYAATETALALWVDGKPYSKAAYPVMVIRCRGGDKGRGSESMSFIKPVKKTPDARTWTSLKEC